MLKPSKKSPSTADLKARVLWGWYSLCSMHQKKDPDACETCGLGFWLCVTHMKEECEECPDG